MVHDETAIDKAIEIVERVLTAAKNSNQAGEDAVVAMAAAGDLLIALRAVVPMLEAVRYQVGFGDNQMKRLAAAKAAVAKAKGEAVTA